MKQLRKVSHKLILAFLTIGFCLIAENTYSQIQVRVRVTNVTTTIGDCDGDTWYTTNNSDPTWWWTGPGVVDDQCFGIGGPGGSGRYAGSC